jgi:hypothetical protein
MVTVTEVSAEQSAVAEQCAAYSSIGVDPSGEPVGVAADGFEQGGEECTRRTRAVIPGQAVVKDSTLRPRV